MGRKVIAWMAGNHVAATLLMLALILGGLFSAGLVKQEIFPDVELDIIEISVNYPGAGPEDIEEGIVLQVEDAVRGITGIREVRSTAADGYGRIYVELEPGEDTDQILQDIKNAVDRISTFPEAAERPLIRKLVRKRQVLYIALYGDASEHALRYWAEQLRNELLSQDGVSQVELTGVRPHEITISVPEDLLRRYSITLSEIARLIRESAQDVPAGEIKTEGDRIRIRTKAKKYWARDFRKIAVITRDFGLLYLGDIVRIEDSFRDLDLLSRFDGQPAAMLEVFRTGDEKPLQISRTVKMVLKQFQSRMPSSIHAAIWKDRSDMFKQRRNLLLKNAALGLCMVLVVLGLFLELRLAFWVMMGIPISFLGAICLMPLGDVSINMISLFAFIMALGIVVDDAIVVGENIFEHRKRGLSPLDAAVDGTCQVAKPVVIAVLTSIIAFTPLLFVEGSTGKFISVIPKIVIFILAISLIESLLILPAHLNTPKVVEARRKGIARMFAAMRIWISRKLLWFINRQYAPALERMLQYRYLSVAAGISAIVLMAGVLAAGIVKFSFMPRVEADTIRVTIQMVPGVTISRLQQAVKRVEQAAHETVRHFEKQEPGLLRHIYTAIGGNGAGQAVISMNLVPSDQRKLSAKEITAYWRDSLKPIPGVEYIQFKSDIMRLGANIHIRLSAPDFDTLESCRDRVVHSLGRYPGVTDITSDLERGEREFQLRLRPEARALGLTAWQLGQQVRSAFYGAEALRMMRGENEVWVMVKYPEEQRRTVYSLYDMRIATPDGSRIPITKAAEITEVQGFSSIKRVDRRRVVNITASVDQSRANAREILMDMQGGVLRQIQTAYPGVKVSLEGESRASKETMGSLKYGFLAVLGAIYLLLAIPFRSYTMPLIVMCSIPFGLVGAVMGHMLLGYDLSIMSVFGMVALCGVVINDALLLMDYAWQLREKGMERIEAMVAAGKRRFRPILLTTLTTFFGLTPMLLERSLQAKFLVPMAISLAFGILFATVVTLVLIPAISLVFEDLKSLLSPARTREMEEAGGA